MKLLILSVEFPPGPGGYGTLAHQAALQLSELGWQVRVASPQDHASPAEIARFNRSQPYPILRDRKVEPPILEGLYRLGKALHQASVDRPDVILAIGRHSAWVGALVSTLFSIPFAVVGVGTEFLVEGQLDRALTRWAFSKAGLLVAISDYAYGLARSRGFDLSRAQVLRLGADETLYRPGIPVDGLRQRLGLDGERILLTVGQVSERKAQDVVVQALPAILEKLPNVTYLIAGLPTRQKELEKLAGELGVAGRVRFAGRVNQSELPAYYNLAEVFVLVSRQAGKDDVEGFGIAAVEAALCGKPAVVSRSSGLVEAVVPGETALVVPPDDPPATADAILQLLENDRMRQDMGSAACNYALQNATWKKRMLPYHSALIKLINKSGD
jgi:phosphatidylinositol alpha-1,6-mannosyltransferase